ncbi:hypothetical protein [Inconstantimicrobium mannanitabidum]|uniref:Uncharacterized protein n=1 Tax=Inconstantimicrobium mannanitabidum TaxID=1604901 RepID=A0ACB5R8L3_9CLOT|nr:hypothetical protein [Clostridium sp. TW13]GKX65472.1 hypothetical protein rsdtw13_07300 [Clostridium sp. TW13]
MNEQIEALKTASEYIDNLKGGINTLVKFIEEGEEEKGCGYIPLVADGIEWLMNVVDLTQEFHEGKVSLDSINQKLEEIVEALENEDYTLVGDLFNYEILPILEQAQVSINSVIQN